MKRALFWCFLSAVLFSLSLDDRFTAIPAAQRAHRTFSAYREYRYTIKSHPVSSGTCTPFLVSSYCHDRGRGQTERIKAVFLSLFRSYLDRFRAADIRILSAGRTENPQRTHSTAGKKIPAYISRAGCLRLHQIDVYRREPRRMIVRTRKNITPGEGTPRRRCSDCRSVPAPADDRPCGNRVFCSEVRHNSIK